MKKIFLSSVIVLWAMTALAQTKNFIDQPYIEVAGAADTMVTPNEIYIRIAISEKDTRDRTSVEELERKMVAALKALGIDTEKELTTSDMASNFRSYLFKSKDVLKAKEYILKVSDAVMASNVFMQLEALGISNTSIDRVDHSDLELFQNLMRTRAVEDAKTRAVALTKSLNQTVGVAINIIDDENYDLRRMGNQLQEVVVTTMGRSQSALPKIEFKKIRVAANINVKFVLK